GGPTRAGHAVDRGGSEGRTDRVADLRGASWTSRALRRVGPRGLEIRGAAGGCPHTPPPLSTGGGRSAGRAGGIAGHRHSSRLRRPRGRSGMKTSDAAAHVVEALAGGEAVVEVVVVDGGDAAAPR